MTSKPSEAAQKYVPSVITMQKIIIATRGHFYRFFQPSSSLRINVKLKSKNKIELAICIPWSWSRLWSVLWLQLPNLGAEATAGGDGQILHENEQNKEGWRRLEPSCVCSICWLLMCNPYKFMDTRSHHRHKPHNSSI